jgi:hypothetical protein
VRTHALRIYYNPYSVFNEQRSRRSTLTATPRGLPSPQIRALRKRQTVLNEPSVVIISRREGTGGAERDRTDDLLNANQALSQLSYSPRLVRISRRGWMADCRRVNPALASFTLQHSSPNIRPQLVGLGRFELPTSRLSGVRSNQLSYRPVARSTRSNSPSEAPEHCQRPPRPPNYYCRFCCQRS